MKITLKRVAIALLLLAAFGIYRTIVTYNWLSYHYYFYREISFTRGSGATEVETYLRDQLGVFKKQKYQASLVNKSLIFNSIESYKSWMSASSYKDILSLTIYVLDSNYSRKTLAAADIVAAEQLKTSLLQLYIHELGIAVSYSAAYSVFSVTGTNFSSVLDIYLTDKMFLCR